MFLSVDIGNSNIKLGLFDNDIWVCTKRIGTPMIQKPEVAIQVMQSFFSEVHIEPAKVTFAGLASVVPQLTEHISSAITERCKIEPLIINSDAKLPVSVEIENPEKVGADRIANACGGFIRYGGPVIVVDMGTASKFDVVTQAGAFIGGVIAPGAITALHALAGNAAQLFDVPFERPASVIGKHTIGAMQSGAYFGTVGQIDSIIERILSELQLDVSKCKVVGTGGLIETIAQDSKLIKTIHPELTLEGIFLIANENSAS